MTLEIEDRVLADILIGYRKYLALQGGGVDNWMGYCDSINEYIEAYNAENKTNFESIEEIIEWEMSGEDIEDEVE